MRMKRRILSVIAILILLTSSFTLAEGDYEQGDGWSYQDGTLTILENNGLKDFISNDQDEETGEWKYQHSVWDVATLVIGNNVTCLTNEIYDLDQIAPQKTIIESGNTCFSVENGWVINTRTKTLYGAANVPEKRLLSSINDLSDDIVHIGDGAFYRFQDMNSISLPQSIVSIGNQSFEDCKKLASVSFPEGLESIGFSAFADCENLNGIYLGEKIHFVEYYAFFGCINLEQAQITDSVLTQISERCLSGCSKLKTLELPKSISLVGTYALGNCYELNTLIINSDRVGFEDRALFRCDNLRQIIFTKGSPETLGETFFGEIGETADGRYYISNAADQNNLPIPYPTLFYTAAYADEWAPNGETEWNGYPIEEISQDELNAILAEARGEPAPTPIATATSAATAEVTISVAQTEQTNTADTPLVGALVAGLIVTVVAVVIVGVLRKRKGRKSDSDRENKS